MACKWNEDRVLGGVVKMIIKYFGMNHGLWETIAFLHLGNIGKVLRLGRFFALIFYFYRDRR